MQKESSIKEMHLDNNYELYSTSIDGVTLMMFYSGNNLIDGVLTDKNNAEKVVTYNNQTYYLRNAKENEKSLGLFFQDWARKVVKAPY